MEGLNLLGCVGVFVKMGWKPREVFVDPAADPERSHQQVRAAVHYNECLLAENMTTENTVRRFQLSFSVTVMWTAGGAVW